MENYIGKERGKMCEIKLIEIKDILRNNLIS